MTTWPLRFRPTKNGRLLFADDAGGFFQANEEFLERYVHDKLTEKDHSFLAENGHSYNQLYDLSSIGFASRWAARHHTPKPMNYVILVPTLRCNLDCTYCQVSRVNENARGFDWTEDTLRQTISFLDSLETTDIKIEFQGGEPLLRVDLLQQIRDFCRTRFKTFQCVVCTNLQVVSEEAWEFLGGGDTLISTSIDGTIENHRNQRTKTDRATDQFSANLRRAVAEYGNEKVSALPTLDPNSLPDPEAIIDTFTSYGMRSIYLRPVNFLGFARKRFDFTGAAEAWKRYYYQFIDQLVEYNTQYAEPVEEYYFSHCLRRMLRTGHHHHVDLRNPNLLGRDYIVIDHDGVFYPTDEARMVTRTGQIDLSIGSVFDGIDEAKLAVLNENAANDDNPDCMYCVYQPFCGVDLIDDLSRYGRVDIPKHLTDFCQRHMGIFDKIISMLYSADPKVQKSMALWAGVQQINSVLIPVHE